MPGNTESIDLKSVELQALLLKLNETEILNARFALKNYIGISQISALQEKHGRKRRKFCAEAAYNFAYMNRPKRIRCLDWSIQLTQKLLLMRNLCNLLKNSNDFPLLEFK